MGVEELAAKTGMLTVSPGSVLATLNLTKRMLTTGKPRYVVQRMVQSGTRHNTMRIQRHTSHQLKLSSERFLERASIIWNKVPLDLRNITSREVFKTRARRWVRENGPLK